MKEEVCTAFSKNAFPQKRIKTMQSVDQAKLQLLMSLLENPIYLNGISDKIGTILTLFTLSILSSVSFPWACNLAWSIRTLLLELDILFFSLWWECHGAWVLFAHMHVTSEPLFAKNLTMDLVNLASCCCFVLPLIKINLRRGYLSLNPLRLKNSWQIIRFHPCRIFLTCNEKDALLLSINEG